ncbi:hypothetical protein J2W14_001938 [Pseudarthrobacter oxydans]|nr:hypothetical protein [Pseudarthrobacter oxydans]
MWECVDLFRAGHGALGDGTLVRPPGGEGARPGIGGSVDATDVPVFSACCSPDIPVECSVSALLGLHNGRCGAADAPPDGRATYQAALVTGPTDESRGPGYGELRVARG